jgi:MFS family permease
MKTADSLGIPADTTALNANQRETASSSALAQQLHENQKPTREAVVEYLKGDQSTFDALAPEILPAEADVGTVFDTDAHALVSVFRHRNYRLFYSGQLVSLVGTWITLVAQGWLVYSLTQSPFLLGLVSFCAQLPVFFLSPLGGIVADHFDRRRILIATQFLSMAQSITLALLTLLKAINFTDIAILALFQGVINSFDLPARQSMTILMVGKREVRKAVSLNSISFNLARIGGPAIAGFLIATAGPAICFCIDSVSYLAVLTSLVSMSSLHKPTKKLGNPLRALFEGFVYVWQNRRIRTPLILISICSAFGASYLVFLPEVAKDILHRQSEGLGLMYTTIGLGALLGAYFLSRFPDRLLFGVSVASALLFGVSLIGFSQSSVFWLSLLLLIPTSCCSMLLGGSVNTSIQLASRDEMRGRVMAIYAMSFMGFLPCGALILGALAQHLGIETIIGLGGSLCTFAAAIALWSSRK